MIETNRLIIRNFHPSDFEDLYDYLSCDEVYEFEPGEPVSIEQAKQLSVGRSAGSDFFAVVLKQLEKMIGHLYFAQVEPKRLLTWELGYIFNPEYQRKGYGSEAAIALVDYAFTNKSIHRIMARCSVENTASWKMLEKAGFIREGYFRKYGFVHRDADGNPIWDDVYEYSKVNDKE
jgi:RimJ/RimL family protein N-acetyltransferase